MAAWHVRAGSVAAAAAVAGREQTHVAGRQHKVRCTAADASAQRPAHAATCLLPAALPPKLQPPPCFQPRPSGATSTVGLTSILAEAATQVAAGRLLALGALARRGGQAGQVDVAAAAAAAGAKGGRGAAAAHIALQEVGQAQRLLLLLVLLALLHLGGSHQVGEVILLHQRLAQHREGGGRRRCGGGRRLAAGGQQRGGRRWCEATTRLAAQLAIGWGRCGAGRGPGRSWRRQEALQRWCMATGGWGGRPVTEHKATAPCAAAHQGRPRAPHRQHQPKLPLACPTPFWDRWA